MLPSNNTPRRPHRSPPSLLGAAIILSVACALIVGRTQVPGGKIRNFRVVPEYYKPPHETQMKSLLQGAEAEPLAGGKSLLIRELKLQTFREAGEPELVIETPQCTYDSLTHSASSPSPLRVQTGDGKFSIEGEGFLWQQTNSSLIISNRVHTVIQPELLARGTAAVSTNSSSPQLGGLEIFADQFEYATESGLAIYRGNVRVAGTNLSLASGVLTLVVPRLERRLQSITAEEKVTAEYQDISALGERLRYDTVTGVMQLSGNPGSWRAGQREGLGDECVIETTNKVFRANGHAVLKMAGHSTGASGFLPTAGALGPRAVDATNQPVEIACDSYEIKTNSAIFRERVRVTQGTEPQTQSKLSCDLLTVKFSGTNELQEMRAENNVVIEQKDNQLKAGLAVYRGTTGMLDLTQNPSWRAGPREGKGDALRVNVHDNTMWVDKNAIMRLPAQELRRGSTVAGRAPEPATSVLPRVQFAEISSREYTLSPQAASFRGDVRVDHPQMQWRCGTINAQFSTTNENVGRLVAEQEVRFELAENSGEKLHGTSDKAIYTSGVTGNITNDLVELTGNPVLLQTTNGTIKNRLIILDLARHELIAPGNYSMRAQVAAGPTNKMRWPGK